MSYSAEYKRRVQNLACRRPDMTIPAIWRQVDPGPGEHRAHEKTVATWVVNARGRTGMRTKVTPAMIAETVALVVGGMSMSGACDQVNARHGIRGLDCPMIRRHLPEGFVYVKPPPAPPRELASDRRWPNHIRAEIMEMVIGGGLSPRQARRRIEKKHGRSPAPYTIARWCGVEAMAPATREPKAAPLQLVEDPEELDTYGRAWAAAEGLDGAAWAEAVMRAWLPPDDVQASEPDVRVLSTRRRAA